MLALDPGLRGFGWASFRGTSLAACGVVRTTGTLGARHALVCAAIRAALGDWRPTHCVVERMVARPHAGGLATANDLLDVQALGAAVAASLCAGALVWRTPAEWKGQTPTEVIERRLEKQLRPAEWAMLQAVRPASLRHNAVDAVALGRCELERL